MKLWTKTFSLIDLISCYEEIACQLLNNRIGRRKCMTSMQVEYSKLKESQRHNLAMEQQARAELTETHRANVVRESLSRDELNEQIRHAIASETETYRHNSVSEQEITAHNRATEQLMRDQNAINKYLGELNVQMQRERTVSVATTADLQRVTDAYYKGLQTEINDRLASVTESKAKGELEKLKAETQNIWEGIGQRWTQIYQDRDYKEAMADVARGQLTAQISQNLENNVFRDYELDMKTTELAINSVNNTLRTIQGFIPIPQIKLSGDLNTSSSSTNSMEPMGSSQSSDWAKDYSSGTYSKRGIVDAAGRTID